MVLGTRELALHIDHTLLKPAATVQDLDLLCAQAVKYGFYGVCVNPSLVSLASWKLKDESPVPVSVVGFPLGATLPEVKAFETAAVVGNGAQEVDMVMNLGAFKAGDDNLVLKDIRAVVEAADGAPVKVILETALLSDEEIVRACRLSVDGGAKFVKTSTGFGPGGATVEAVRLMRETVGPDIGVKASGGIGTYDQAIDMLRAGANRIGASASVTIVTGE
ncbi:deoxyribose-phosphate aldolase [Pseudodesulfovibrio cashew]|uniref:Deoxyribose-phosphate aldolase n=1 Tax=Pseudodesulfovibrio cashew TaxID=2678688 RepID=A0A6I6JKM7_9BACT|nr:deoxyribose-phosphate aldolase [Pseudodesulfovibrio cashew]QGY41528.1 deoxyribose-phosphate aldolase [Pseudodesulfovibrio cashew]